MREIVHISVNYLLSILLTKCFLYKMWCNEIVHRVLLRNETKSRVLIVCVCCWLTWLDMVSRLSGLIIPLQIIPNIRIGLDFIVPFSTPKNQANSKAIQPFIQFTLLKRVTQPNPFSLFTFTRELTLLSKTWILLVWVEIASFRKSL